MAGLTQFQLAQRASLSEITIVRLEAGLNPPRMSTVAAIAHALDVNVSQLLSVDEP